MRPGEIQSIRKRMLRHCLLLINLGSLGFLLALIIGGYLGILEIVFDVLLTLTGIIGIRARNQFMVKKIIHYKICLYLVLLYFTVSLFCNIVDSAFFNVDYINLGVHVFFGSLCLWFMVTSIRTANKFQSFLKDSEDLINSDEGFIERLLREDISSTKQLDEAIP